MSSHSKPADTADESSPNRYTPAPTVSTTGLGYRYVRCQRGDDDSTVYIHQLCAIAGGADPHDVFSDAFDTHHRRLEDWLDLDDSVPAPPTKVNGEVVPPIDTPESVEARPRWDHRADNLEAGADD